MLAIELTLLSMETHYRWDDFAHLTDAINYWEFRYAGSQDGAVYKIHVQVDPDRCGEAYAGFTPWGHDNWDHASSHESLRANPAVVTAAMADALRRVAAMKKK
jgi:hypothetical protein